MGLGHSPSVVTDGMILYFDAANTKCYSGSGTTANDLVTDDTLSMLGGVTKVDDYFAFDGSDDVITIPHDSRFNVSSGVSIEAVVWFDSNSNDFIFEKGNVNTQYSLFSPGDDIVFRTHHGSLNSLSFSKSTAGIVNGEWVHIVGSWDGTTKRLYVNTNLVGSNSESRAISTSTQASSIGRFGGTTTGYYFDGRISRVAVYNRGITTDEVAQNFAAVRGRYGL